MDLYCCFKNQNIEFLNARFIFKKFTINATMPCWSREPDADQRIKLAITGFKNGLYKSRKDAAKSHQIHCAGDLTANINLTKSRILTSSDYYPLQNLQLCDSVYTLEIAA